MTPDFQAMVETRFRDLMLAQYPSVPLYYSNTPDPEGVDVFAVIHVLSSDETIPASVGGKAKSRNVGVIHIEIFAPKDRGAGEAKRMAYYAGNIFKRQVIPVGTEGSATFKESAVQDRGEVRGRHKHMARVPYSYDFTDVTVP